MTDKFEVEVKEIVSKIQDLTWDNLEVAEESKEEEPRMEGVFQDGDSPVRAPYVPDPQVDVNVFSGLGPIAELMHQGIRAEMRYRDHSHSDNHFRIPEPDPEIREEQEESEITIDWREDTMRYYRDLICRGLGITSEDLAADERLTAYYQSVADVAIQERLQLPTERILEIARDARTANVALDSERLGAECMDAYREGLIQNTTLSDFRGLRAAIRDLVDSVMASFGTFFKACALLFDVRVLCVWDEFVWKMKRRMRQEIRHEMETWEIHLTNSYLQDLSRRPTHPMTEVEFNGLRARGQAAVLNQYPPSLQQKCPPGVLDLGTATEKEIALFRADWSLQYAELGRAAFAFCTPSRSRLTGRQ